MRDPHVPVRESAGCPKAKRATIPPRWSFCTAGLGRRIRRLLRRVGTWRSRSMVLSEPGAVLLELPYRWATVLGRPDPYVADLFRVGARSEGAGRFSFGTAGLAERVRMLLAGLGPKPGSVAATLRAAGVRAGPGGTSATRMSRYLSAVVGADPRVHSVVCDRFRVTVTDVDGHFLTVGFSAAVVTFNQALDYGRYPDLELPPSGIAQHVDRRSHRRRPDHFLGDHHGDLRCRRIARDRRRRTLRPLHPLWPHGAELGFKALALMHALPPSVIVSSDVPGTPRACPCEPSCTHAKLTSLIDPLSCRLPCFNGPRGHP
jgi:hypothetical protein